MHMDNYVVKYGCRCLCALAWMCVGNVCMLARGCVSLVAVILYVCAYVSRFVVCVTYAPPLGLRVANNSNQGQKLGLSLRGARQ